MAARPFFYFQSKVKIKVIAFSIPLAGLGKVTPNTAKRLIIKAKPQNRKKTINSFQYFR